VGALNESNRHCHCKSKLDAKFRHPSAPSKKTNEMQRALAAATTWTKLTTACYVAAEFALGTHVRVCGNGNVAIGGEGDGFDETDSSLICLVQ